MAFLTVLNIKLDKVTLKRPEFDLKKGLLPSSTLPWVPLTIDSAKAREEIENTVPIDGREVVEWMHYSASDNAVFEGMSLEYNRLGSQLVSGSGDAYIPGVGVGDLRGESIPGYIVTSRGYGTVRTPRGTFNVRVGGKSTFANGDILAWAALPWASSCQWVLSMLQWRDLASTPVTERVRFAGSNGLVAPNFFSVSSRIPAPVLTMRIGLTSNKPQTIVMRARGTKGSYEYVAFEDSFNIDSGESEVVYFVYGLPFVSPFTLELQPEDNTETVLDYIDTIP